jgi:biotin carboxyl carrier protein
MAEQNKYIVNNKYEFDASSITNGKIIFQEGSHYKFLFNEKIYAITLLNYDSENKVHQIKINGFKVEVKTMNPLDQLIAQLGFNKPKEVELKEILSPMPGLVKQISIKEGDEIEVGQNLFILEAMKMENIIKSSGTGTITKVMVNEGEKVEKGKILAKL